MVPSTPGADAYRPEGSSDSNPPQTKGDDSPNPKPERSINSHYDHRVGIWHAASLVLNASRMLYAQLGLSGVVFSSAIPPSRGEPRLRRRVGPGDVGLDVGGRRPSSRDGPLPLRLRFQMVNTFLVCA